MNPKKAWASTTVISPCIHFHCNLPFTVNRKASHLWLKKKKLYFVNIPSYLDYYWSITTHYKDAFWMCMKCTKTSDLKVSAHTYWNFQLCNLPDVKGEILFQNIHWNIPNHFPMQFRLNYNNSFRGCSCVSESQCKFCCLPQYRNTL